MSETTMRDQEDDFTHYFNATARLSAENAALREQLAVKEQECVTLRQLLRDAIEAARC